MRPITLFRLGVAQFAIVLAGLATVAALVWIAHPMQIQEFYVHTFLVPTLQHRYGFETGIVTTESYEGRAIVHVTPNGAFARFGVRPYDVPFGYPHGGGWSFMCEALDEFERGRPSSFEVVNVRAWSAGNPQQGFRTIELRP